MSLDDETNPTTHLPGPVITEDMVEALAKQIYAQRQATDRAKELEAEKRKAEREKAVAEMKKGTKRFFRNVKGAPKSAGQTVASKIRETKETLAEKRENAQVKAEAEKIHQERVLNDPDLLAEARRRLEEQAASEESED